MFEQENGLESATVHRTQLQPARGERLKWIIGPKRWHAPLFPTVEPDRPAVASYHQSAAALTPDEPIDGLDCGHRPRPESGWILVESVAPNIEELDNPSPTRVQLRTCCVECFRASEEPFDESERGGYEIKRYVELVDLRQRAPERDDRLGKLLKRGRIKLALTRPELAEWIGRAVTTIEKLEGGQRNAGGTTRRILRDFAGRFTR